MWEWCKWLPGYLWDWEKNLPRAWTTLQVVVPTGTPRKSWDTPAGISPRAAEEGALATIDEALRAVLKENLKKSCPQPGSRPAETQDFSITWEGPQSQETEEGGMLFLNPLQTPERITIQWQSLSSGEGRAEPHPSLVLTPITGKNSRKDLMVLPLGSYLNHWTITQVIAVFGSISNILDSPLGLHCHICVCNATSSSSQSLCKRGKLLDPIAFLSQSHVPTPS